jgi:aconitate hydratase
VRAVIAQSFERIHRSNLVAMGLIPLQLVGASPDDVAPTGEELISVTGLDALNAGHTPETVTIISNGTTHTPHACASTLPAKRTTSATEGSCHTFFGTW